MENASKALIIAGAILLSILIIGLGMLIFTQAKNAIGNTGLDQQKVLAYNQAFLDYEGIKSGSDARQLCQNIVAHNIKADDSSQYILVQNGDASAVTTNGVSTNDTAATFNANINAIKKTIKSGKMYEISIGYDEKTGYVCAIGIQEQ